MSADWIKFECTTPDKPEVIKMAAILGIDQDSVVGKLLRIWVWADQNTVNGNALTVTHSFLDRITFCAGFARAMQIVGWLDGEDGCVTIPRFDTHNGKSAKERAVTNRRVAKSRKCNGQSNGVTVTEGEQKPLPEKRREEKIEKQKIAGADAPALASPKAKAKRDGLTFAQWADDTGPPLIPKDDPVFDYAASAGIPREFVALAWSEFDEKYAADTRRQKDWRAHFRNAVRGNWFKLWWFDGGSCQLTTAGVQAQRARRAA